MRGALCGNTAIPQKVDVALAQSNADGSGFGARLAGEAVQFLLAAGVAESDFVAGTREKRAEFAALRGNKPGHKCQSVPFVSSRRNVRNMLWSVHLGVTPVQFRTGS
jgi:hypothetical protein